MPDEFERRTVSVSGMVCSACEGRIGKRLLVEDGISEAKADCIKQNLELVFDPARISLSRIDEILQGMDFSLDVSGPASAGRLWANAKQVAGLVLVVFALYFAASRLGVFSLLNIFPEAEAGMGYGMILLVGLLTSAHCLAMCGGINLSQTGLRARSGGGKLAAAKPTMLYGVGRVISYTVIGALAGGLGSVISIPGSGKGIIQIIAGVFMMIMGLNLMGMFPLLRRLIPRLPVSLSGLFGKTEGRGPLYVGLLNGFMPCGPLQAMQLYALSTGNPLEGALSMLAFSVGTLPLTMGLGMIATFLGRRFMGKAIRIGAALVFFMGLGMLGNGLTLSGFVTPALAGSAATMAVVENGRQTVTTRLMPDTYQAIHVQAGVPLLWHITVERSDLNGCNNRILIPEFNIEQKLFPGDNLVEFTPQKDGVYPYMCWMGMIASRIVVGGAADTGMTPAFDASDLPQPDEDYIDEVPWLS